MSASQIDVGTQIASIQHAASTGQLRLPHVLTDGGRSTHGASAIGPETAASWLSFLRVGSIWEGALIAVLFLLIGGLVSVRLADYLSDHELDLSSLQTESTQSEPESDEGSPTDEPRPYEHYLSPDTPSELLSDEGEVVRLLVANQGRIRQHRIADETGWSKSKVSRICSQMHEDDTIEKTSVGRENVIVLAEEPGADPADPETVENAIA